MALVKKQKGVLLIIIDQFKKSYAPLLDKTSQFLTHTAICDTCQIPSSTEAGHATISTGQPPSIHGYVSKHTIAGENKGIEEIEERLSIRDGIESLASRALRTGYFPFILGGKPEAVRVMGLGDECALRIIQTKDATEIKGTDDDLLRKWDSMLQPTKFGNDALTGDLGLLLTMSSLLKQDIPDKSLVALTLPGLDRTGHEYGPDSPQVESHLDAIDGYLSQIISRESARMNILITGDHGCRRTGKHVIEIDEKDPKKIRVYHKNGRGFEYEGAINLDREERTRYISFDGGILRIWLKEGVASLSEEDEKFLCQYGEMLGPDRQMSHEAREIYENSYCPNLGDLVVVSNADSTFCKARWINKDVFKKLPQTKLLLSTELPLGEHGSYHVEDRLVPLMTDHHIVDTLRLQEIAGIIERML